MKTNNIPDAAQRFRKKWETYAPVSDDEFQYVPATLHEKHFSKGEVLLKEGQVCNKYYFIYSGSVRSFCLEDGREVNLKFYFEDDIACDFASFRSEEPSQYYLIAMEDTITYCAAKKDAVPVFQNSTSWVMILFRFFQQLYFE